MNGFTTTPRTYAAAIFDLPNNATVQWRHHGVTWLRASAQKTSTTASGGVFVRFRWVAAGRNVQDTRVTKQMILPWNKWATDPRLRARQRDPAAASSDLYSTVLRSQLFGSPAAGIGLYEGRQRVTLPSRISCSSQHSPEKNLQPGTVLRWDRGQLAPKPRPCPPNVTWNTVWRTQSISKWAQNRAFCGLQNTPKYVFGRGLPRTWLGNSQRSPRSPNRLKMGHGHPIWQDTPLGDQAPRLGIVVGKCPKISSLDLRRVYSLLPVALEQWT